MLDDKWEINFVLQIKLIFGYGMEKTLDKHSPMWAIICGLRHFEYH
jgi:hypothetical protein